jgi:hypothetical protein
LLAIKRSLESKIGSGIVSTIAIATVTAGFIYGGIIAIYGSALTGINHSRYILWGILPGSIIATISIPLYNDERKFPSKKWKFEIISPEIQKP